MNHGLKSYKADAPLIFHPKMPLAGSKFDSVYIIEELMNSNLKNKYESIFTPSEK